MYTSLFKAKQKAGLSVGRTCGTFSIICFPEVPLHLILGWTELDREGLFWAATEWSSSFYSYFMDQWLFQCMIFPKPFPSNPRCSIQPSVNTSAEAGPWVCVRKGWINSAFHLAFPLDLGWTLRNCLWKLLGCFVVLICDGHVSLSPCGPWR